MAKETTKLMIAYFITYILGGIPSRIILNDKIKKFLYIKIPFIVDNKNYTVNFNEVILDSLKAVLVVWILPKLFVLLLETPFKFCLYPYLNFNVLKIGLLISAYLGHVLIVYLCGWGKKGSALLIVGSLFLVPQTIVYLLVSSLIFAIITRSARITSWLTCLMIPLCIWYYDSETYVFIIGTGILACINTLAFLYDLKIIKKYDFENKK